jgi:hypothetical protein
MLTKVNASRIDKNIRRTKGMRAMFGGFNHRVALVEVCDDARCDTAVITNLLDCSVKAILSSGNKNDFRSRVSQKSSDR